MAPAKEELNMENSYVTSKEPRANRQYKDTVFRMLFSDRKKTVRNLNYHRHMKTWLESRIWN